MGCRIGGVQEDNVSLSDALLFTTMCIIGLPVDVLVKDGSVYSGIFHTACAENNYGIVLKNARITKKGNRDSNVKNADVIETLVILSEDLVQVVAKRVLLPADGLTGNFTENHTEAVAGTLSSCESTGRRSKITKSSKPHVEMAQINQNRGSSRSMNGYGHEITPQRMVEAEKKNSDSKGSKREVVNIPITGRQVEDVGSQRRQHKIGANSYSQSKEFTHEVQVSKPRLAACDTQAASENISLNTSKGLTGGECYDGLAPSTVKLDYKGDERHPSAPDLSTYDAIPSVPSITVPSSVDKIKESRLSSASMPTELVPPRSLNSNRISKESKLNPGAKIFSPSLPQQRTATLPAAPTVASLPYVPDNYPVVRLSTSQPEVEVHHFPPRSSLPVKFVPYGNMMAGTGGNDVHNSPPIVGHVTNRTQQLRYGAQYHPVQAGPTYAHPNSQNVMVGRWGHQLVYVHPVSQDGVQGSTGFSQVATCSLLTPHQIHLPKHNGTTTAQALQLCVTPPFISAAGPPQFAVPSHVPISQPPFPMIRPFPVPGSNGFLGSKFP